MGWISDSGLGVIGAVLECYLSRFKVLYIYTLISLAEDRSISWNIYHAAHHDRWPIRMMQFGYSVSHFRVVIHMSDAQR